MEILACHSGLQFAQYDYDGSQHVWAGEVGPQAAWLPPPVRRPSQTPEINVRNLSTSLDTPFDDKEVSQDDLAAFSTDHRERLIANDADGALTTRITATRLVVACRLLLCRHFPEFSRGRGAR
ncbi:MAG: hypothetical protein KDN20_25705 [Verrucomicrobiae bacterium]|nr:hypothetical protein [Verrucomicrobiae bacterium]